MSQPCFSIPDSSSSHYALVLITLQGFTRPKVLLLLPQRNMAFRAVVRLVRLAMAETRADSVQGKAKFVEQFGDMNPEDEDEMDGGSLPD